MEMVDPWVAAEAGGEQERTADMFAPDGGEKRRGEGARVEKPVGVAAKLSGHLQVHRDSRSLPDRVPPQNPARTQDQCQGRAYCQHAWSCL